MHLTTTVGKLNVYSEIDENIFSNKNILAG